MTVYGDHEPEDAFDALDPPDVIARNLARRLDRLAVNLAARGGRLDDRDRVRLDHLLTDVAYLRGRLGSSS